MEKVLEENKNKKVRNEASQKAMIAMVSMVGIVSLVAVCGAVMFSMVLKELV